MVRTVVPRAIRREDSGLRIDWDGAGHQGYYPARPLRLRCPCALCIDEMTGRPLLDPTTVPADVSPVAVRLVGGYAIQISWSDGHGAGILPFQTLLAWCPCDRCRPA